MRTFLPAMWAAFFIRVRPASRNAKPACMNITSTAATTTQSVLAARRRSEFFMPEPPSHRRIDRSVQTDARATPARPDVGIASDASRRPLRALERQAGAVVRDVLDPSRPDEPVAVVVAAARRVGHACCDRAGQLVGDHEREQRLRQEARLEHAPAVLVRDPALAAVTDCLDDRHADVPRLLLDRVDHGLDPLAQDDSLHLRHVTTSLRRSSRTTSLQTPCNRPIRSCVPSGRKPKRRSRPRLSSFSGKTPVCSVQMPARSELSTAAARSSAPMPSPRAPSATYALTSAT